MKFLFAVLCSISFFASQAQSEVKLTDLKSHIGEVVKVKGHISSVQYRGKTKNKFTVLNIEGQLALIISKDAKDHLGYNPSAKKYINGLAIVTGKVELDKGKPQIIISDPSQLGIKIDEEIPASEVPPIEN